MFTRKWLSAWSCNGSQLRRTCRQKSWCPWTGGQDTVRESWQGVPLKGKQKLLWGNSRMRACIASRCFHGYGEPRWKNQLLKAGGRQKGHRMEGQHLRCVISVNVESPRGVLSEWGRVMQAGRQAAVRRKGHHLLHFTGFETVVQQEWTSKKTLTD